MTLSCLPCELFCSCRCKVRSRVSDALSQALRNLSLAFLAYFILSDSTAPICFIVKLFSLANYNLLFAWIERQDHSVHITATCLPSYRYSSSTLRATLCRRHTYCQWPIIELAKNVSPRNATAASHVVQIHTHARFSRSKKWPTCRVAVPTGNALASLFRENRLIFDLHSPLRRLVSFVARIIT